MRYSPVHDCYYLHWDNAVCHQLAHIQHLEEAVLTMSGLQRYQDDSDGLCFLSCDNGSKQGEVRWKMDFSKCGLVISKLQVKARWDELNEEAVEFAVIGDDSVKCRPLLGDQPLELPELKGCRTVTLVAMVTHQPESNGPVQLLTESLDAAGDCPLDITADLMVARREDVPYAGELLLGVKYTSEEVNDAKSPVVENLEITVDGNPPGGQLQVHIVEGAGLIDEDTFKPYNTFAKCDLLPADTGRFGVKQTSPRHNAYPTWAKQFVFNKLSKQDLVEGGLEIILYDHRVFFHDSNIGGVRLCTPQPHNWPRKWSVSPDASPARSRSGSPAAALIEGDFPGDESLPGSPCTTTINLFDTSSGSTTNLSQSARFSRPSSADMKSKSLPRSSSLVASQELLPQVLSPERTRTHTAGSPNRLSPVIRRRDRSQSPTSSPKGSPIAMAKNLFRLSGSHLRDLSPSPQSSPILGRRKLKAGSRGSSFESEFLYPWMDSTGDEVTHWQQVMDCDGQWVYFWHALRPKLKAAYTS